MGAIVSKVGVWFAGLVLPLGHQMFINGGQFVWARTYNLIQKDLQITDRESFKYLQQQVATSALHDSAQRADPPRCHPNTREAVLQQIFDWMVSSDHREAWLMWLNGAAGAGKSAIAQSTAERCVQEKRFVISFFFSGTDPTRNNMGALAATLSYQLILLIPETAEAIFQVIDHNPLIFGQSLESQIKKLFIDPLVSIQHLFPEHMLLVILDGLDECQDEALQCSLIEILGRCMSTRNLPVQFLIASRPELHIETTFKLKEIANILVTLPLDDVLLQASEDIRQFLNDKFAELKDTHPIGPLLPKDWPASSSVEDIIVNSSGQFIYASLAMSYIASPRGHPVHQLQVIERIRINNPSSKHPLDYLDTLYRKILSRIEFDELGKVLDILAYVLFAGENRISVINWAFQFAPGEVEVALADLAAVVTCDSPLERGPLRKIRLLHASLADFLLDESRSEAYHISSDKYSTKLACFVFALPPMHFFGVAHAQRSVIHLLENATPSAELHHVLLHFTPEFEAMQLIFNRSLLPLFDILIAMKNLCFHNNEVYHHFLSLFQQYLGRRAGLPVRPKVFLNSLHEPMQGNQIGGPGRHEIMVKTNAEVTRCDSDDDLTDLRGYLQEMRIDLTVEHSSFVQGASNIVFVGGNFTQATGGQFNVASGNYNIYNSNFYDN